MNFYVSVHYCWYTVWPFGLFRSLQDYKPMEVSIISENGSAYYAQFSSISSKLRIVDSISRERFANTVKDDWYKSDKVIKKEIMSFFDREAKGRPIELYTYSNYKTHFLPGLLRDKATRPEPLFQLKYIGDELASLLRHMDDDEFGVSSEFEYQILKEDDNAPYTHWQRLEIFNSHPDWPKPNPKWPFDRALWVQKAHRLIKRYQSRISLNKGTNALAK